MPRPPEKRPRAYWQAIESLPDEALQLKIQPLFFPSDRWLVSALYALFQAFGIAQKVSGFLFVAAMAAQFVWDMPGAFVLNVFAVYFIGGLGIFLLVFLWFFARNFGVVPAMAEKTGYLFYETYFAYTVGDLDHPERAPVIQAIPYAWIEGVSVTPRKREDYKRLGHLDLKYRPSAFPDQKQPPFSARRIPNVAESTEALYALERLISRF